MTVATCAYPGRELLWNRIALPGRLVKMYTIEGLMSLLLPVQEHHTLESRA